PLVRTGIPEILRNFHALLRDGEVGNGASRRTSHSVDWREQGSAPTHERIVYYPRMEPSVAYPDLHVVPDAACAGQARQGDGNAEGRRMRTAGDLALAVRAAHRLMRAQHALVAQHQAMGGEARAAPGQRLAPDECAGRIQRHRPAKPRLD